MESTYKKPKSLNNFKLFIRLGAYHQLFCILNVYASWALLDGPLVIRTLYALPLSAMHILLILRIKKLCRSMNPSNLKRLQNCIYSSIPVWIVCTLLGLNFMDGPTGGLMIVSLPFTCLFYMGLGTWIGSKKHVQDISAYEIWKSMQA